MSIVKDSFMNIKKRGTISPAWDFVTQLVVFLETSNMYPIDEILQPGQARGISIGGNDGSVFNLADADGIVRFCETFNPTISYVLAIRATSPLSDKREYFRYMPSQYNLDVKRVEDIGQLTTEIKNLSVVLRDFRTDVLHEVRGVASSVVNAMSTQLEEVNKKIIHNRVVIDRDEVKMDPNDAIEQLEYEKERSRIAQEENELRTKQDEQRAAVQKKKDALEARIREFAIKLKRKELPDKSDAADPKNRVSEESFQ